MGIIGVLWLIGVALKALGVALATTSWLWVVFWPVPVVILLAVLVAIFGAGFLGLGALLSCR